jgi:heme O synthase-like polyprenyltransferase
MSAPSTASDEDESRERLLRVGAVVFGLLLVLYSVVVAQQILAAVALLLWVFVVYLAWRFVRAHERLADAAERLAGGDGDGEAAAAGSEVPDDGSAEE